jgi:hypothetical protein
MQGIFVSMIIHIKIRWYESKLFRQKLLLKGKMGREERDSTL